MGEQKSDMRLFVETRERTMKARITPMVLGLIGLGLVLFWSQWALGTQEFGCMFYFGWSYNQETELYSAHRVWEWDAVEDTNYYCVAINIPWEWPEPMPVVSGSLTYPPDTSFVDDDEDLTEAEFVALLDEAEKGYYAVAYTTSGIVYSTLTRRNMDSIQDFLKGDPIDISDGSLRMDEVDFAFQSPGADTLFSRTYRTRRAEYAGSTVCEDTCGANRHVGKGWEFSWDTRLIFKGSGRIIFARPDGNHEEYDKRGAIYMKHPRIEDTLDEYDDNGTTKYKVTTLAKTIYWFDDEGKIDNIGDACGRETTFTYDGSDNLTMVTDTAGREYSIDYNGNGNIEHVFIEKTNDDPPDWDEGDLTLVTFTYDATDSDLLWKAENAEGEIVEYTYEEHDTKGYSYLIKRENNENQCNFYTYDEDDEVYTAVCHGDEETDDYLKYSFTYSIDDSVTDDIQYVTTMTDANDRITTFYFKSHRGMEKVEYPDGTTVKYEYDSSDNVAERIVVGSGDYSGYYLKTVNTWGDYSNLLTTVTRKVATEEETIQATDLTFSYDEANFPSYVTEIEDALGHKVYYDYDGTTGALLKVCNKDGSEQEVNKTQYEYYGSGDGVKNGLLKKVTDGCSNETLYDYDSLGNLVEIDREILPDLTFSYDEDTYIGVPTAMTIPGAGGNRQITYTYDARNRLLSITYPAADTQSDSFSVHYTYQSKGDVTSKTLKYDGVAYHTTNYTYNEAAFLTHVKNTLSTTDDTVTEYTYDDMGNLTEIEDPLGRKIQYAYDDNYRLNKITYYEDGSGDKYEGFAYYPDGSRLLWTSCAGTTYTYEHNSSNLLQYIKQDTTTLVTYTYLDNKLLDTIQNENGTVDYGYDDYNRRTSVDGPLSGTVDKIEYQYRENGLLSQLKYYVDGSPVTVDYTYNDLNQLTELDYASGTKEATYAYDSTTGLLTARALPNGTTTSYAYDDLDRLLDLVNKESSGAVIDSFGYHWNTKGLRDEVTYTDGRYTTFSYDNLLRLTAEVQKRADETVLYDLQHTVDKSGNRTVLQYENNANKQVTFTYNALNQVTGYSGTRGNKINVTGALPTAWTLETVSVEPNSEPAKAVEADLCDAFFVARNVELEDATDNSIEASADSTSLAGNSVTSDTESSITFDGTPDVDFGYDEDGRRIYRHVDTDDDPQTTDDETDYTYDFLGRLTEIEYDDGSTSKFFYDALGRKFKEEEWDATPSKISERRYVYNGFTVILELDGSNDPVAECVYGPGAGGIGGLLFQKRDNAYSYYNYDAQGNVTSITDEMKNTVALYEYSAYGRLLTRAGSLANDLLYSTKPYHAKSGLYYFGFRWYDPATGRWMTRDPLRVLDGFNVYAYLGSDPAGSTDPYGLCQDPDDVWWETFTDNLNLRIGVSGTFIHQQVSLSVSFNLLDPIGSLDPGASWSVNSEWLGGSVDIGSGESGDFAIGGGREHLGISAELDSSGKPVGATVHVGWSLIPLPVHGSYTVPDNLSPL